jgi:hypothetical protein
MICHCDIPWPVMLREVYRLMLVLVVETVVLLVNVTLLAISLSALLKS